jgi:hypothetical protein
MECWLACYQMMYGWKNKADDIETKLGPALKAPLWPAGASDATTVADCMANGMAGKYFFTACSTLGLIALPAFPTTLADLGVLITAFKSPLWVAGRWYNNATNHTYEHVLIVIGVNDYTNKVECINPEKPQPSNGVDQEPWNWVSSGAALYNGILAAVQAWAS